MTTTDPTPEPIEPPAPLSVADATAALAASLERLRSATLALRDADPAIAAARAAHRESVGVAASMVIALGDAGSTPPVGIAGLLHDLGHPVARVGVAPAPAPAVDPDREVRLAEARIVDARRDGVDAAMTAGLDPAREARLDAAIVVLRQHLPPYKAAVAAYDLEAAGWMPPLPYITTADELDALPDRSIVLSPVGEAWQYIQGIWGPAGRAGVYGSLWMFEHYSPLRVLHAPEPIVAGS